MSLITLTLQQGCRTWWFADIKEQHKKPCEELYANEIKALLAKNGPMTMVELMEKTGFSEQKIHKGTRYLRLNDEVNANRRFNGKNTYYKVWSLK